MSRFIKVGEAAKILGVSISTLRRWELENNFLPDHRSGGGTRYYLKDRILGIQHTQVEPELTVAYARVSSHDQKKDLKICMTVGSLIKKVGIKWYHAKYTSDNIIINSKPIFSSLMAR